MGLILKNGFAKAVRRRKTYVFILFAMVFLYTAVQIINMRDRYRALQPLYKAELEAQRLLKFLTSYHYQCNSTVQIGNTSQFPLCTDKMGFQVEDKEPKLVYSVNPVWDFAFERALALNLSSQVFIISHRSIPYTIQDMNNTHVIKTVIVPNDYADFSRNSYGQQTINDLMSNLKHRKIDILKIREIKHDHEMWEMIHFMSTDNLLLNVDQLHFAVYIDKIDDDALYNWYRTMYELYYQQGFRLYHTAASDSLCLQVTMMQSCMYFTSWVRIPSNQIHVLHPPADFGTEELEEERLLDYLGTIQEDCGELVASDDLLQPLLPSASSTSSAAWWLCHNRKNTVAKQKCLHFSYVSRLKKKSEDQLSSYCAELIVEPMEVYSQPVQSFSVYKRDSKRRFSWNSGEKISSKSLVQMLHGIGAVSVVEIRTPGREWEILHLLLNSGFLQNVTQLLLEVQLPDVSLGKHHSVYRHHYSELRRLQSQQFQLYNAVPLSPILHYKAYPQNTNNIEDCCFRLTFIRVETSLQ